LVSFNAHGKELFAVKLWEELDMKACKAFILVLSFLVSIALAGCGSSGGSGSGSGTGTLSVSLADSTLERCKAVYVTINEVQVHGSGGWRRLEPTSPYRTHNLLELQNGVREELGVANLAEGSYTQMRMIIGDIPDGGHPSANYIIDENNQYHDLKIPSGYQSGIKIIHLIEIESGGIIELILDFCASESIVTPGHDEEWLLKPTIKVIDTDNYSVISGMVTEDQTGSPLEGVFVSAQIPGFSPEHRAVVQALTQTEEDGTYSIFLYPGTYNIVAYMDGYYAVCVEEVVATPPADYLNVDLILGSLTASLDSLGTVEGMVHIQGGIAESHATLSFRQSDKCGADDIEVKSLNVAQDGTYSIDLPPGTYYVTASTVEEAVKVSPDDIVVTSGLTVEDINITILPP
jgi:hypothetical protein